VLVLFDCDGTLLVGDDPSAQESMIEALNRLTGGDLDASAMDELDHEARCARWLARELIRKHGLPRIDLAEWARLAEELYLQRLGGGGHESWEVPAGTHDALATLTGEGFRLAILTGVPERIARVRFQRLGLAKWFPRGQGAFGSEVDERDELIRLALRRADTTPEEAVAVGDTSRDVRSAERLGLSTVAVALNGVPPRAAGEADEIVRTMPDLVEALRRLR
jgi:phosphoglycolate phosphatase